MSYAQPQVWSSIVRIVRGARVEYVEHVEVNDSDIQAIAEALRGNTTLQEFGAVADYFLPRDMAVLSDFLAALRTCEALTTLSLAKLQIRGAEGAVHLAGMITGSPRLSALELSIDELGAEGAAVIADALRAGNASLTKLALRDCAIGDDGAEALAEALGTNRTLARLDLRSNGIGARGALALGSARPAALTHLVLSRNEFADEGARALFDALRTNRVLTALDLARCSLGDGAMPSVQGFLAANATLTSLDLSGNRIGDRGAQVLCDTLASANTTLAAANTTLAHLNISSNDLGTAGARAFGDLLAGGGAVEPPAQRTSLTSLGLGLIKDLDPRDAARLGAGLAANGTLTSLGLRIFSIPADTCASLCGPLAGAAACAALTSLDLRECGLADRGAAHLGTVLASHRTLTSLTLVHNNIRAAGAASICDALAANPRGSLTHLDLSWNSIFDAGAAAVAALLAAPRARDGGHCGAWRGLVSLNLGRNLIGPDGTAAIAAALHGNTTLTHLDLRGSSACDSGAAALAAALAANTALTALALASNTITGIGQLALLGALGANSTLRCFQLGAEPSSVRPPAAPLASVRVPLTAGQRLALFASHRRSVHGSHQSSPSVVRDPPPPPISRLPADVVRRIATCYPVAQGARTVEGAAGGFEIVVTVLGQRLRGSAFL
jgi:Ran GTPase-activating protein (RanGAP) involved in mRNA processing and transport